MPNQLIPKKIVSVKRFNQIISAKLSAYALLSLIALPICAQKPLAQKPLAQAPSAQEQTPAPLLETLLVQGTRTAPSPWLAQKTLTRAPEAGTPALADMAQALPGLQVDKRTNAAQDTRLSVRGFGARSAFGVRGVKLYQDELPLTSADGQGQLSTVLVDQVQSMTLIRGPLAGLMGGGAGAAVLIERAPISNTGAQLQAVTGEWGLSEQSLSGSWTAPSVQLRAALAQQTFDGARAHSRAEREQLALDGHWQINTDWQLQLAHESARDPKLQDPLGLTESQWRDDPQQVINATATFNTRKSVDNHRTSAQLRFDQDNWQARMALWQGERAVQQYLPIGATGIDRAGGVIDFTRDFVGANASLAHTGQWLDRPLATSVGFEWSTLDEDRQGYVNRAGTRGDLRRDEQNEVNLGELYWLSRWALANNTDIYAGARKSDARYQSDDHFVMSAGGLNNPDDSGRVNFNNTSWAGGFEWRPVAGLAFDLSHGTSYETPTLTEMAYSLDNQGFNRDLSAARARQWQLDLTLDGSQLKATAGDRDLGAAWRRQWQLGVSGFVIETDDELLVAESQGGRTVYRNGGSTQRQGLELDGRWTPLPTLRLSASTSYLDSALDSALDSNLDSHVQIPGDSASVFLPGVARFQQHLELRVNPESLTDVYATLGATHRSRVYADDANTLAAPAYTRWDLTIGYAPEARAKRGTFEAWLTLGNITDTDYVASVIVNQSSGRAFEPGLPRQLVAGVRLRL